MEMAHEQNSTALHNTRLYERVFLQWESDVDHGRVELLPDEQDLTLSRTTKKAEIPKGCKLSIVVVDVREEADRD